MSENLSPDQSFAKYEIKDEPTHLLYQYALHAPTPMYIDVSSLRERGHVAYGNFGTKGVGASWKSKRIEIR